MSPAGPHLICTPSCSFQKNPAPPAAKTFPGVSFLRETRQHRTEFRFDVRFLHHVFPNAIKARAGGVGTEPDLITSRRFADERDLRHVRPRATVRAAGRADDDFLAAKAEVDRKSTRLNS